MSGPTSSAQGRPAPSSGGHCYDADGDCRLKSSDGQVFELYAFRLQASSPTFRDIFSIPTDRNDYIELTDTYLETASVLKAALDLIVHGKTIASTELTMVVRVIRFLSKWEMSKELAFVRLQLSEGLATGRSPWEVFVGAAWLEEWDLCARAIHKAGAWVWTDLPQYVHRFGHEVHQGRVFDVTTWSRQNMDLVPADATWAILRASRQTHSFDPADRKADYKEFGDEFARLMQLPGIRAVFIIRYRGTVLIEICQDDEALHRSRKTLKSIPG